GGDAVQADTGSRIIVRTTIAARRRTERLAVVIDCKNEDLVDTFNTSSQRLGRDAFTLEAGERLAVQFALRLYLAPGTYHIGVYLYRYDIQKNYDTRSPARTFYVRADADVRGIANLEPEITRHEKAAPDGT